jgi:hypothetical protein
MLMCGGAHGNRWDTLKIAAGGFTPPSGRACALFRRRRRAARPGAAGTCVAMGVAVSMVMGMAVNGAIGVNMLVFMDFAANGSFCRRFGRIAPAFFTHNPTPSYAAGVSFPAITPMSAASCGAIS